MLLLLPPCILVLVSCNPHCCDTLLCFMAQPEQAARALQQLLCGLAGFLLLGCLLSACSA
jgi:hypothetical protein